MPSTVKVRIKAARNLASLNPAAITTTRATPSNGTTNRSALPIPISPRSSTAPVVILPDAYVTVSLGGHSAVAEYDEDDEPLVSAERSGTHHSRTASKFQQWQGMLGTSGDTSGGAGDDSAQIGASGGGSTRTSRCYSARTRTVRRSVNPAFNEEFRFEVADDTLLQDEPLLFHVREEGGQHGSIGLVYVDLKHVPTRRSLKLTFIKPT